MSQETANPLDLALAYHEAWARKDLDKALSYVADDVICDAPGGRIEGIDAYRAFLEPFFKVLKRSELVAAFGDEESALLMYDTTTAIVPSGPAVEFVVFEDGAIMYIRLIFDRAPYEARVLSAA